MDVVAKGPAEAAGLAVGDRIVQVDGASTSTIDLPYFRRRLAVDPPGTAIDLVVRSATGLAHHRLVLRDLLPAGEPTVPAN
jgi:C-terminal processing protease CtpA/Prc